MRIGATVETSLSDGTKTNVSPSSASSLLDFRWCMSEENERDKERIGSKLGH